MAILAMDFGTTYLKATLFDDAGRIVALHRQPLETSPQARWELDPAAFREMIVSALGDLRDRAAEAWQQIAAVSFATQTNSFVLLDRSDQPLTPIILWPDTRATAEPELVARFSEVPDLKSKTGLAELSSGFMLAKLAWIQRHQPEIWSHTARLSLLSDFVTLWMTGQHVTEAGAAGLTGLVDVKAVNWWPAMCAQARLDSTQLPRIARPGTDFGPIRREIAAELSLPGTCRFVVGCLDQYAGAIGTGNVRPGSISETTGTVLASIRCSDHFEEQAAPGVFQGPAFESGMFYQMCFGDTSANLLEAFRDSLPDRPSFEALDAAAAEVPPGCEGLLAWFDARTRQVAFNQAPPTAGHGARAIMEAVAAALRDQVQRLCGENWVPRPRICAGVLPATAGDDDRGALIVSAGGAARSPLWLQIKADMLNVPFASTTCPEPTSLGAAILAAGGLGWGSVGELATRWVKTGQVHEPVSACHEIYNQEFAAAGTRPHKYAGVAPSNPRPAPGGKP